jgi:AAA domain
MAMVTAKRGSRATKRPASAKDNREAPQAIETEEVQIELEDLSSFAESINILIYGPSGHGKTVLAGGAPNSTFVSTEKGVVAAKIAGSKSKLIRTPSWERVVAAKRYCDDHFGEDDWVIFDSLTKMQVLMIRWILRKINEDNSGRDLDIPAIQDHQKWQNYFKRFVDSIIDAPYNTILICTEMYKEDQDGDDIVLPAITGKDYEICNYIRAQTDVNLFYQTKELKNGELIRRALAQPWAPYVAPKDRYQALGRYWDVADGEYTAMADMISAIQDSIKNGLPAANDYEEDEEDE